MNQLLKKILITAAIIALSIISVSDGEALEMTVGQAQISHLPLHGDRKLEYNELNEIVDIAFGLDNRYHAFIFQNSFGDIAPSVSYDVYRHPWHTMTINANLGIAYYKSNVIASSKPDDFGNIIHEDYTVDSIHKIMPTMNINIEKRFDNVIIGASFGGVYVGSFFAFVF